MFKLTIDTDNAAFGAEDEDDDADARSGEVARILRDVAEKTDAGYTSGTCMDINGNTVGKWSLG